MSHRFPLALPSWDETELAAMQRVIHGGRFTMGDAVARFEADFAQAMGSRHAVMVNSGSSANLLMIAALTLTEDASRRLRPGDEVIVPAVSWSTTYSPLHQYGLRMRFVDVDPATLNADPGAVEAAVGERTRAIFAVNLLGNPNNFDRLRTIARRHRLVLIEDNCESMGARFGGRYAGTFGAMGSFSCFFSHHISTMEGGLICTDDDEFHHLLLSLRAHGWTRNLPATNRVTGTKDPDPFVESFRFVLPGYNVRPLELSGAIGIEQIRKLPSFVAARRRNAARFVAAFHDHPDVMVQSEIGESSWFGFSLIARPQGRLSRADLRTRLDAAGFETRPIVAGNFARQPVMRHYDAIVPDELPGADLVDRAGLFVGNHHFDMPEALDALEAALDARSASPDLPRRARG
jgi:CDP-6-deoxy-D-xylo-4-hexulose-3-dehydrase